MPGEEGDWMATERTSLKGQLVLVLPALPFPIKVSGVTVCKGTKAWPRLSGQLLGGGTVVSGQWSEQSAGSSLYRRWGQVA